MASIRQLQRLPLPLLDSISYRSATQTRSFALSCRRRATVSLSALDFTKGNRERIVVLGSGWAGYVLSQRLSSKYQVLVVSPRSYFVFTPLLNSTAVGTLEFRNALEPIRSRKKPHVEYMQGWADDVDFGRKMLTVEESVVDARQSRAMADDKNAGESTQEMNSEKTGKRKEGKRWEVPYDKLIVTVGCYSQTFGTKGVKENAFFMKDVGDARRIRTRVLECFEIANLPTTSDKLREQLLKFVIVGGGPTGMEFAAELSDLVHEDLTKLYPALVPKVKIAVYDVAPTILSMFDEKLAKYAMQTFRREGVEVNTSHHVKELRPGLPCTDGSEENMDDVVDSQGCYTLTTEEGGDVGVGLCVWSTGNMTNPFVRKALDKTYGLPSASAEITSGSNNDLEELDAKEWMIEKNAKTGTIVVDDRLRVQLHSAQRKQQSPPPKDKDKDNDHPSLQSASTATMLDVFALGDNASIRDAALPATAQTAAQQAIWLAKRLNKNDLTSQHFTFRNLGVMTYLGNSKGLVQTEGVFGDISGRAAWLIWRGAYLTMSVSWRNKILIPTYWFLNWAFGRDISRF